MFSPYQGLQYLAGDVNGFANQFNPGMMDQFNQGFQHGRGAPGGHRGGQYNPGFQQPGNGQQFMQRQGTLNPLFQTPAK